MKFRSNEQEICSSLFTFLSATTSFPDMPLFSRKQPTIFMQAAIWVRLGVSGVNISSAALGFKYHLGIFS